MTTIPAPDEHRASNGLHADAVAVLESWQSPDSEQESLRRLYLQYLAGHRDAMSRQCAPDHLTASALIFSADRDYVLLTLHRRVRRWLQTGGHCEPSDDSLAAAARREAVEESGITELHIHPSPILLARHLVPYCGDRTDPGHHLDVQYVAWAAPGSLIRRSQESTQLRWWPAASLPPGTDESVQNLVTAGASLSYPPTRR